MFFRIFKSAILFSAFYLIKAFIISWVLFPFADEGIVYNDFFLHYFFDESNYAINSFTTAIYAIDSLIELLATAILTGCVFAYIVNWTPKIILPDKLVIRHRTSSDVIHRFTLGVLIGNKSHCNLHNVVCSLIFSYRKQTEPRQIVSDVVLHDDRLVVENYYRFSFPLVDFPKDILSRIIDNDYGIDDSITVSLTGSTNYTGNTFHVEHKYKLSDIAFDEHTLNVTSYYINWITGGRLKIPFTNEPIRKIHWDQLTQIINATEAQKKISIEEIKKIMENSSISTSS